MERSSRGLGNFFSVRELSLFDFLIQLNSRAGLEALYLFLREIFPKLVTTESTGSTVQVCSGHLI